MTKAWSGNKGEWGEMYVLLRVLDEGILYNGDNFGNRYENQFALVRCVKKENASDNWVNFRILGDKISVEKEGFPSKFVPRGKFKHFADVLLLEISKKKFNRDSSSLGEIQAFLEDLGVEKLKASSFSKFDLKITIYDGQVFREFDRNFSIKTLLGSSPTLLNASDHLYMRYEIQGIDFERAEVISKSVGNDLSLQCRELLNEAVGIVPYIDSITFENNLRNCNWAAPQIVPLCALNAYAYSKKRIVDCVEASVKNNPLNLKNEQLYLYEKAMGHFLFACVSDMTPGKHWSGDGNVDGFLVVNPNGQVCVYQMTNQADFEKFLMANSYWDTPSTKRFSKIGKFVEIDRKVCYFLAPTVRFKFQTARLC